MGHFATLECVFFKKGHGFSVVVKRFIVAGFAIVIGFALAVFGLLHTTAWASEQSESGFDPARFDVAALDLNNDEIEALVQKGIQEEAAAEAAEAEEAASVSPDVPVTEFSTQAVHASTYQAMMKVGLKYLGYPYIWGGRSPQQGGFDCAGLVEYVANEACGAKIDVVYTDAATLYNKHCNPVSKKKAKPGDFIFWKGTDDAKGLHEITHAGIYCGSNIALMSGSKVEFFDINRMPNIYGQPAEYVFATLKKKDIKDADTGVAIERLYNPYTTEHFYTTSQKERNKLMGLGWRYEGVGWVAPTQGDDVYRLYNPYSGDHHYTTSAEERDNLVKLGWKDEKVAWKTVPANQDGKKNMYRLFNPYAKVGTHHYTESKKEYDKLVKKGWRGEDVCWYAVDAA